MLRPISAIFELLRRQPHVARVFLFSLPSGSLRLVLSSLATRLTNRQARASQPIRILICFPWPPGECTKRNARFAQSPRHRCGNLRGAWSVAMDAHGLRLNRHFRSVPRNDYPSLRDA